jgi:hypothetical protein
METTNVGDDRSSRTRLAQRAAWPRYRIVEIVGPPTASGKFRSFLAEMPGSAPTYKKECKRFDGNGAAPAVDLVEI